MAKSKKTLNKKNKERNINHNNIEISSSSNDASKIVKCVIIVIAIFAVMYLITLLILNNSSSDYTKRDIETSIQYSEILAGTSFQKKDKEYLVLFYNSENDAKYLDDVSNYQAKDNHLPIYYVDLKNKMNSSVVSEESNKEAKNASDLKVKSPTLIKFVDNEISEYIDDKDEISKYLSE